MPEATPKKKRKPKSMSAVLNPKRGSVRHQTPDASATASVAAPVPNLRRTMTSVFDSELRASLAKLIRPPERSVKSPVAAELAAAQEAFPTESDSAPPGEIKQCIPPTQGPSAGEAPQLVQRASVNELLASVQEAARDAFVRQLLGDDGDDGGALPNLGDVTLTALQVIEAHRRQRIAHRGILRPQLWFCYRMLPLLRITSLRCAVHRKRTAYLLLAEPIYRELVALDEAYCRFAAELELEERVARKMLEMRCSLLAASTANRFFQLLNGLRNDLAEACGVPHPSRAKHSHLAVSCKGRSRSPDAHRSIAGFANVELVRHTGATHAITHEQFGRALLVRAAECAHFYFSFLVAIHTREARQRRSLCMVEAAARYDLACTGKRLALVHIEELEAENISSYFRRIRDILSQRPAGDAEHNVGKALPAIRGMRPAPLLPPLATPRSFCAPSLRSHALTMSRRNLTRLDHMAPASGCQNSGDGARVILPPLGLSHTVVDAFASVAGVMGTSPSAISGSLFGKKCRADAGDSHPGVAADMCSMMLMLLLHHDGAAVLAEAEAVARSKMVASARKEKRQREASTARLQARQHTRAEVRLLLARESTCRAQVEFSAAVRFLCVVEEFYRDLWRRSEQLAGARIANAAAKERRQRWPDEVDRRVRALALASLLEKQRSVEGALWMHANLFLSCEMIFHVRRATTVELEEHRARCLMASTAAKERRIAGKVAAERAAVALLATVVRPSPAWQALISSEERHRQQFEAFLLSRLASAAYELLYEPLHRNLLCRTERNAREQLMTAVDVMLSLLHQCFVFEPVERCVLLSEAQEATLTLLQRSVPDIRRIVEGEEARAFRKLCLRISKEVRQRQRVNGVCT